MRRFIVALAFLLAGLSPALAQNSTIIGGGVYGDTKVAAAGYTGPGDLKTFSVYYTLRAFSAATRGATHFVINLCTPADVHCEDEGTDATTGKLSLGTFGSTCNNSTVICTIKEFYDQSGNSVNATQSTIANRLIFVTNCIGTLPCANGTQTSSQYAAASSATVIAQPWTIVVAAMRTGSTSVKSVPIGFSDSGGGNAAFVDFYDISGDIECAGGSSFFATGISESAFHVIQFKGNGTSSDCNVDNTAFTASAGGTNSAGLYATAGAGNYVGASALNGDFLEGGLAPSNFSAAGLNTNIHTFWGF